MVFITIIVCIFLLDTLIKGYMMKKELGKEKAILGGSVCLRYTKNYGLAFGWLQKFQKAIQWLVGGILVLLTCLFAQAKNKGKLLKLGFSLIIGGGLSNFYDRISKGYVIDYMIFPVKNKKISHTVFNVSDFFIIFGILCLGIYGLGKKILGKKWFFEDCRV